MGKPENPRTLFVATTGGHLEQLFRIAPRLVPSSGDTAWVTHDDAQSRSMLAGLEVHMVPYVPPRGYLQTMENVPLAHSILRQGGFTRVVSTGAAVALPFLAAARMRRIPCHYIESAARADGPSLTGRLLSRIPGIHLYTQYSSWSDHRWQYRGSLFDGFAPVHRPRPIARVVVTLGTMRAYTFSRAVDRLRKLLPQVVTPGADILWQLGPTPGDGLTGRVAATYPQAELKAAIADADLVIAHSGIGSALTALELGRSPVLLPRRTRFGEHIDDHQSMIAKELNSLGLAVSAEAHELTAAHLLRAAATEVKHTEEKPPFDLVSPDTTAVPTMPSPRQARRP